VRIADFEIWREAPTEHYCCMNILWLPHSSLRVGRTRSDHLIERLASRHHVTVASFRVHPTTRPWRYLVDLATHRSRRGASYDELAILRFPKATALNGWLLNRTIIRELTRRNYDMLVVAPAPYLTGYLDFGALRERVPLVCDYLDGGDWTQTPADTAFERRYVQSADAVICVSQGLLRQALSLNPRSYYVPNGVELDHYRQFKRKHTARECKAKLGIDPDAYVVSIIGMTCSPRLYFVDAIVALARRGKKILLLLVGESDLLDEIRRRAGQWRHLVRIVGGIPYSEIMPYFMASDLGLSAVDDHPYFHFQSPLKIFEYGAMGKPVLAAPMAKEVAEMQLSCVRFCDADAESLAHHIENMMASQEPAIEPDLDRYDWGRLASTVEEILSTTIERRASRRPGAINRATDRAI
jgi:glycosyltransferase involved in cell wall biosynthesis